MSTSSTSTSTRGTTRPLATTSPRAARTVTIPGPYGETVVTASNTTWALTALAGIVAAVLAGWAAPAGPGTALAWAVLAATLPVLTLIDCKTLRLPNRILYPAAVALLGAASLDTTLGHLPGEALARGLFAGLALFAVMYTIAVITAGNGLGMGDVKLYGLVGFALGLAGWPLVLWAGLVAPPLLALGPALALAAARGKQVPLPFGPFIALAGLGGMLAHGLL